MLSYKLIFIFLLIQSLIPIVFASIDNDCSCPKEKIFESNVKEGVIKSPGYLNEYCGSLECKWNIQPAYNTFIYAELKLFETEERVDTLDVYQTRWNGSNLMKVKQASLSGKNAPMEYFRFSSSINGGLLFHFITDRSSNYRGFEIHFSRKSENNARNLPCPQPFHFATNIPQYLPVFPLEFLGTCIFSINSTQEIKLTIRALSESELFGIEVFETENFPNPYEKDQRGQLKKIKKYYPLNTFPLTLTSGTGSVSILLSSYDLLNGIIPYSMEFVAIENSYLF
uniref:CUB domain-containing protein n=1 Tax=Meloidogyne incognita TaxID=6306 RepID=A0A914M0U9_MELIC